MNARFLAGVGLLAGCGLGVAPEGLEVATQRVRAGNAAQDGAFLSFHLLATEEGQALPCVEGAITASVRYRQGGGAWQPLPEGERVVRCADGAGDVGLVLDNSGSEAAFVPSLQAGATDMVDGVIGLGGRASLVRVSTNAEVLVPVTEDAAALHAAIAQLGPTNGWTALYDGVRMGNETLGGAVQAEQVAGVWPDLDTFCGASEPLGLVVFTDGRENNSADQQAYDHDRYPGDGFDTELAHLHNLRVGATTTPIYTVALGDRPEHAELADLARRTGGRHLPVADPAGIQAVFDDVTDYFGATSQVCATLPEMECGPVEIELSWSWTDGARVVNGVETAEVAGPCAIERRAAGRMALFILTISKPSIGEDLSSALVRQSVEWVAPIADPRVLVVLDDQRRFEAPYDPVFVADTLSAVGYDVFSMEEPGLGLRPADVAGFDVVWFVNPGWPVDDIATRDTLLQFQALGGGLVLQGDDITYSFGRAFPMDPITRVTHVDNGTPFCGVRINNNTGNAYEVTLVDETHPVIAGVEGSSFLYTDDIDNSVPVGLAETVLAWANLPGGSDCPSHPAILVFDPAQIP